MTRKAHLVGAWPGRDPEHAMEAALKLLAPHLARMSDGETGDRHLWVTPSIDSFRANPDVEMLNDGNWTAEDDIAKWRVRDGVTMNPDNIGLRYSLAFEGSFPAFKVLRERFERPDLTFQVGIPMPIDLSLFVFGEVAFSDTSIVEACTEATVREIAKIHKRGGDEVIFQLETVVQLISVAGAEDAEQEAVAKQMAAGMIDVASRSPKGARFGMHLCLGDFHHRAFGKMRDVRPLVLLANAIAADWPEGRSLEYIHAPFAAAAEPPIPEESFYQPLEDLQLPDDVRFIAGFQHESLDLDAHRELLERIERLAGREVDVAASCGLGRRPTPEEAFEAMHVTAELIESPAVQLNS